MITFVIPRFHLRRLTCATTLRRWYISRACVGTVVPWSSRSWRASPLPAFLHNHATPLFLMRRNTTLNPAKTGKTYRLSIAAPFTIDPKVAYPVLYVLDGNFFFGSAAYIEAKLTHDGDVTPAVVVGIGYPTDNWDEVRRRRYDDLSPWPLDPAILRLAAPGIAKTGGGGAFLRFIDKDVKPFVAARFKVDSSSRLYSDIRWEASSPSRDVQQSNSFFQLRSVEPCHLLEQPQGAR